MSEGEKINAPLMADEPLADIVWVPYLAIEFVEELLRGGESSVWEWGSGCSTRFFARRAAAVISIECNPRWHQRVTGAVAEYPHCIVKLIEEGRKSLGNDPRNPKHYYEQLREKQNFRRYASAIDEFGQFDLIVIDGMARPSCWKHGYTHVKLGGWLLLDNTDRGDLYINRFTRPFFQGWEERIFFGPGPFVKKPWEARAWRKPG